jgi:hypothetical protein
LTRKWLKINVFSKIDDESIASGLHNFENIKKFKADNSQNNEADCVKFIEL